MKKIPADFPVRPLSRAQAAKNPNACTCGTCGRSWDDSIATSWTPTPSGRCPFEYYHAELRERSRPNRRGKFWKIDENRELPLAVIEDTPDGMGVCEIGAYTKRNLAHAREIVEAHNARVRALRAGGA